jgi:hypothetical protein
MKFDPFTFQCANLVCDIRSNVSATCWFSSEINFVRFAASMSCRVGKVVPASAFLGAVLVLIDLHSW